MMDTLPCSLSEIQHHLSEGETTCEALVEEALSRIKESEYLNVFISIDADSARKRARVVDTKIKKGQAGVLAGMVMGIKDTICLQGMLTTCGSRILSQFIPPYNATVIERLLEADAIFIGKTNMDEFAMGSTNETSYFGPVLNPRNPECVAGGSSGGSAAAVGAGIVSFALGSDTGGSIRQPASFCGVTGLKPTYGRVSRYGLVAYASSLDQIGPIANSVTDAAFILQVIAGKDPMDSTSVDLPVPDYTEALRDLDAVRKLRVGVPQEYCGEGLEPEIGECLNRLASQLREKGIAIEFTSLPLTEYCVAAYYIIATAEASSNLSRYDGVRYGYRAEHEGDPISLSINSRREGFGKEVKRRIMLGTYVLSSGYYEAYYRKAQKVRRLIKEDFDRVFQQFDCLLTPVAPTGAFRLGEKLSDPLQMYLSDIYTISANLAGIPGLAVPYLLSSKGMPIGFQILGKHFNETALLQLGRLIETIRPADPYQST